MVKFSHGCWHPAPDTLIDWAVEVIKGEAKDDHLHFVTVSQPLGVFKLQLPSSLKSGRIHFEKVKTLSAN